MYFSAMGDLVIGMGGLFAVAPRAYSEPSSPRVQPGPSSLGSAYARGVVAIGRDSSALNLVCKARIIFAGRGAEGVMAFGLQPNSNTAHIKITPKYK